MGPVGTGPVGTVPVSTAPVSTVPPPWRPPAPKRSSLLPAIAAAVISLAILAALVVGAVVVVPTMGESAHATWRPAPSPTEAGPPPAVDAPEGEWALWALQSVDIAARQQAEALLAGDEDGYLASADPLEQDLVTRLRRRFSVVRAMGPGVWTQSVTDVVRVSDDFWHVRLKVKYCFGEADCTPTWFEVRSRWRLRDGRLVMTGLDDSGEYDRGPRPWETEELIVRAGRRVIVAAAPANATRLSTTVEAAEAAATVADRFARWGPPPSRYVIYLAGPDEWDRWYGGGLPDWAAGYAIDESGDVVLLGNRYIPREALRTMLVHELTHVSTLASAYVRTTSSTWWLTEGLADYATMIDQPLRKYNAMIPVRSYVRDDWDGNPAIAPPSAEASTEEAAARYGIAFLSVRAIAERYTEEKMLHFYGLVVRERKTLQDASLEALGTSWDTVKAQCVDFIRDA